MSDKQRPGWVSGRVRESADGLRSRRSADSDAVERDRRLREAEALDRAEREAALRARREAGEG